MYFTKDTINQLPTNPGIYKMINDDDVIIYIGKAKHLKNRVKSYFSKRLDSIKTKLMVAHIVRIEIIETRTEKEAFILADQPFHLSSPKQLQEILFAEPTVAQSSIPVILLSARQHCCLPIVTVAPLVAMVPKLVPCIITRKCPCVGEPQAVVRTRVVQLAGCSI